MDAAELKALAHQVAEGALSPDDLVNRMHMDAVTDLGYAQVDHARGVRTGVNEIIYGAGKTPEQIAGIVAAMREAGQTRVLITRVDAQKAAELAAMDSAITYHAAAQAWVVGSRP